MIYAVTTNWIRSRRWGKRECTVYNLATRNGNYTENVTDEIASKYWFKQNKNGNIVICSGSGTGFMRITWAIKDDNKDAIVIDTSVF